MIRLLSDYTGAELEQLTDEQIQRLVDLECADAGLPFAPDPPQPYIPLKQEQDVRLYKVGNTGVLVSDRAHAEGISEVLRGYELWTNDVDWRIGYNAVAKRSEDALEVSSVDAYSLQKAQSRKDVLARDAELKSSHEKATEAFNKACELRQKVSNHVWKVIFEAREFRSAREGLLHQLDRYTELAEGNVTVGLRFFEKAHPRYAEYFHADATDGLLKITRNHYTHADGPPEVGAPSELRDEVAF